MDCCDLMQLLYLLLMFVFFLCVLARNARFAGLFLNQGGPEQEHEESFVPAEVVAGRNGHRGGIVGNLDGGVSYISYEVWGYGNVKYQRP